MKLLKFKILYILVTLGIFLDSVFTLSFAYILSYLIDVVLSQKEYNLLPRWILIATIIAILNSISTIYLSNYYPLKQELKSSIDVSKRSLSNLLDLNYKNYSEKDKGFYYNVVTNSAFSYSSITIDIYTRWISNILIVTFILFIILLIDPWISLLFFLYIPMTAIASVKPSQISSDYQEKGLPTQDKFLNETRSIIELKREIDISKTKSYFITRYDDSARSFLKFVTKYKLYEILSLNIPIVLNRFYTIIILSVGSFLYFENRITIGNIFFIYQSLNYISGPISEIFGTLIRKKVNKVNIDRIEELEMQAKEASGYEEMQTSDNLFESSNFTLYRDKDNINSLYDISDIIIPINQFIVIKGPNGSGKTMLVNYLTGNIDPSFGKGNLKIAKSISTYAFLTYPVIVVNGSFKDNMLGITPDPIVQDLLNIDFDKKTITTNPVNLSYGQQQKLNLLRVLSTKSEHLFLDEPLTNLDYDSQKNLVSYLSKVKGTKTIVIITHDNNFDSLADKILIIKGENLLVDP